jgi:hypothetical protein
MLSTKAKELKRMIDPMSDGIEQYSFYVSKRLNISFEEAKRRVIKVIEQKKSEPVVDFLYREVDDRVRRTDTLDNYLKEAEGRVLMPNGCIYKSQEERQSMLALYMDTNLTRRKGAKSKMFIAIAEKRKADASRADNEQIAFKAKVNSPTGLLRSKATALYSPSTNTALTSNSRIVTSTNNINYERLLKGKRHYYNYDLTLMNLNSIANSLHQFDTLSDWQTLFDMGLHPITPSELHDCILKSTRLYWESEEHERKLLEYCHTLTAIERMAVGYSGDLYTFRLYNSEYMRTFVDLFIVKKKATEVYSKDKMYTCIDEDMRNYLQHRFSGSLKDLGVFYDDYPEDLLSDMIETGLYSTSIVHKYQFVLRTLITHTNVPPVVFDIYHMVRDQILMSDTDSGAGTLQDWVDWHQGSLNVTEDAISVSNALVYIASAATQVYIKQTCRNMNMPEDKLDANVMHMKSEFTWIVFGLMSISKHYFAGVNIREGSVFERQLEVKGGSLKSNATPKIVKDYVYDDVVIGIIDDIENKGVVSLNKYVNLVIELEASVIESVMSGGSEYLKTLTILPAETYKKPDPINNSYKHVLLWNDVFSCITNNNIITAPVPMYKYPTILNTKKKIRLWIETITNPELKKRFVEWNNTFNLNAINRLYVPRAYVISYGLPPELKSVVAINSIVTDVCNMAYTGLQILGYYKPQGYSLMRLKDEKRYNDYHI